MCETCGVVCTACFLVLCRVCLGVYSLMFVPVVSVVVFLHAVPLRSLFFGCLALQVDPFILLFGYLPA